MRREKLYTRDKLRCVAHFKRKGAKSREEATVSSWRKAMKFARRWTLTSRCSAWSAPTENSADASASTQCTIFCSFSAGTSALLISERKDKKEEQKGVTRHASTLQRLAPPRRSFGARHPDSTWPPPTATPAPIPPHARGAGTLPLHTRTRRFSTSNRARDRHPITASWTAGDARLGLARNGLPSLVRPRMGTAPRPSRSLRSPCYI
jgi:hypothetical protein